MCVWQSAPPRRETNNALKREPLELELVKHHAEGGAFTTRATRRTNAERIPDLAKINESGLTVYR